MLKKVALTAVAMLLLWSAGALGAEPVRIGLNYPETGPYSVQGRYQLQAANLAVEEINAAGGIAGRPIELVIRDTASRPEKSAANVGEMIDSHGCEMIFGGSSSAVAIEGGKAAKSRGKIYFGTLTYSNSTTGEEGHKYMFRECYNAWMGARVLSYYLRERYLAARKYFYITADYTWGWTTERSIRKFSNTSNSRRHKSVPTPFPDATEADFQKALDAAAAEKPDVLVLVLFGKDMVTALRLAAEMGLKEAVQAVVVPNLTLGMAETGGPHIMEGVIGALPWCWKVPYAYDHSRGRRFVEAFAGRYNSYPSTSAASAYTILYQYKAAVERAGTFDSRAVVGALEDHRFTLLKDRQQWRGFDHQCIQTVYAVRCKSAGEVLKDRFQQDYFEIVNEMDGVEAARNRFNWEYGRRKAGKPIQLEW